MVFTSLPGPKDVEAVALDEKNGLLSGMTAGKAYFDLSTNSPTWSAGSTPRSSRVASTCSTRR